ncbi:uncharacterized protein LOC109923294 [Rhincodon typus]|uniref:uncharacterized protein LOC109923294 n=1 Tax=Rhincodon typus TaxID=259920 RepID=UPI00202F95C7|nr:uncharacterized protein LOC109923294 [Rhincodon typus]XP_048476647.1 uncharacterized protein LOC109923294 [Rhincodon typus]
MFTFSIFLAIVLSHVLVKMQEIWDFPKPVVSLNPSYEVFLGGESTSVSCSCQCPVTSICSCYNSKCREAELSEGQCETYLHLKDLKRGKTSYKCECFFVLENGTRKRSRFTDSIQIYVGDELSKPTIQVLSDSGFNSSGDYVVISCKGDIRPRGGIFYLFNSRRNYFTHEHHVSGLEDTTVFTINVHEQTSVGNYSCRYQTEVHGHFTISPSSQFVAVVKKRKEDHTSKEQDHTAVTLVHLCLSVFVLILMAVIILSNILQAACH